MTSKMEFLSEVVMGKIMKGGKVVLLLSGRSVYFLASSCVVLIVLSLSSSFVGTL